VDVSAVSGGDSAAESGTQQITVTIIDDDSGSSTTFEKGVNFTSGNDYILQRGTARSTLPICLDQNWSESIVNGSTQSDKGQPWGAAVVFQVDSFPGSLNTTSNGNELHYRSLWSQSYGSDQNSYRISLDVLAGGRLHFYVGKVPTSANDTTFLRWTSAANLIQTNQWYGFYVDYDGGKLNNNYPANVQRNYNRFRIWQVHMDNGTTTRLTSYGSNSNWRSYNSINSSQLCTSDSSKTNTYFVGSQYNNTKEFRGQIASNVVTTLKLGRTLPDATEIKLLVTDPNRWLTDYKVGNSYRLPNATGLTNSFTIGGANEATATKVWLMGNGTNDSNTRIRNQVNNTHGASILDFEGSSPPDIQNVTVH